RRNLGRRRTSTASKTCTQTEANASTSTCIYTTWQTPAHSTFRRSQRDACKRKSGRRTRTPDVSRSNQPSDARNEVGGCIHGGISEVMKNIHGDSFPDLQIVKLSHQSGFRSTRRTGSAGLLDSKPASSPED